MSRTDDGLMEREYAPELGWEAASPARGIVMDTGRIRGHGQASQLEIYFATAILVFATNVAYGLFMPDPAGGLSSVRSGDSLVYSSLWGSGYLILALLVGLHFRGVLTVFASNWPVLVLLLAYLMAEIFDPISWLRLLLLFSTATFCAWMACRFSLTQMIMTLHYVFPIVMVVHALGYFAHTGYEAEPLPWERPNILGSFEYGGLFSHKQQAGAVFSISFLFYSLLILVVRASRLWKMLAAATSVVFLLLAGSANAISVSVVTLDISLCLWALIRNKMNVFYIGTVTSIILAMILFVDLDMVFGALGRSSDLTGRTSLWHYWFGFFYDRLLTGYGYSGFFVAGGAAERLWALDDFHAPNFHDAYLDVGIQAGAPGLLALLVMVSLGLVGTCLAACRSGRPLVVVFFAVFLAVCLFGIADSALVSHNNFVTICFLTIYFKLGIKLRLWSASGFGRSLSTRDTQLLPHAME